VDDDYYKKIVVDVACHHFDSDFVVLVVVQDKIDHLKKMVDEQVVDYHLLVDYLDVVMFELNVYLMAIVVVNDLVVIVVHCYLMQNHQRICFYCLVVENMIYYYYPILIEIIKTMVYQVHRHQYEYEIL